MAPQTLSTLFCAVAVATVSSVHSESASNCLADWAIENQGNVCEALNKFQNCVVDVPSTDSRLKSAEVVLEAAQVKYPRCSQRITPGFKVVDRQLRIVSEEDVVVERFRRDSTSIFGLKASLDDKANITDVTSAIAAAKKESTSAIAAAKEECVAATADKMQTILDLITELVASNNKEAQKAVASAERVESNTEEAIDRIKTQVSVTLDTLNKNVTSNFDKLSSELESELDDTVKTVNKSLVQLRKDALTCQRQGFVENAKGKCVPSAQVTPTTCNVTLLGSFHFANNSVFACGVMDVAKKEYGWLMVVGPQYASCKAIKAALPKSMSGEYVIALAGEDVQVYCDMSTDKGGWTLVQKVASYNGGGYNGHNYFTERLLWGGDKSNAGPPGKKAPLSYNNYQSTGFPTETRESLWRLSKATEYRMSSYNSQTLKQDIKVDCAHKDNKAYCAAGNPSFAITTGVKGGSGKWGNGRVGWGTTIGGDSVSKGTTYWFWNHGAIGCNCWEAINAVKRSGGGRAAFKVFGDNTRCWPHGEGGCNTQSDHTAFFIR